MNAQARATPRPPLRLYLLPYAGGGASIWAEFRKALPPEIEAVPLQPPGREIRAGETPLTAITDMAADVRRQMDTPAPGRPYALMGYSMGALIAFELARLLRAEGAPMPEMLIPCAHVAPHLKSDRPRIWDQPDDIFHREVRALGGTPDEVWDHPELVEFLMPLLRADFTACDTYALAEDAALDLPFLVIGAHGDVNVHRDCLLAWSRHTTRPLAQRSVPGGHFFLAEQPALLARIVSDALVPAHA
ncbi:thioesterase II family protein [Caenispirillum salinarum]|uniref:thioesterase II family protein n=1 Tax=Caenispirillum salinarum TaxID=859058 RepID=UPI00384E19AD